MGKSKKTLAQQIAELDEPVPKDFDPEDDPAQRSDADSGSEDSDDGLAGTEHYTAVGKSRLRKPEEVSLGPQYAGSRISREALLNEANEANEEEEEDDDDEDEDDSESNDEDVQVDADGAQPFADPEDVDLDMGNEDGDIDSDAAFGESDEEKFKEFTFRGSGKPRVAANGKKKRPTAADFMTDSEAEAELLNEDGSDNAETDEDALDADDGSGDAETDEDVLDVDEQHSEESEDDSEGSAEDVGSDALDQTDEESAASEDGEMDNADSESGSEDEDEEKARRAELRKIMSEEQKSVVATISKAAKADADKGNAVLLQRKAFDSLLSVRIALQKGLVAANSMVAAQDNDSDDAANEPYQAAEDAAMKLWNTLDGLRQELIKSSSGGAGKKRKRSGLDSSTPSSTIWDRMQASEVASIDNRQATLEKWSNKVRDTTAVPVSRKLNTVQAQSKLAVLQEQVARKVQENENSSFDDTKFYKTLLNNFVDQRRMDSSTATAAAGVGGPAQFTVVKEAKMRKTVDTKASKGRKMRFTVHEKLQNFMAPENRAGWESETVDRFFGTLLGQKMTLGEDEMDEDREEDDEIPLEEQGLMLFRS